MYLNVRPQIEDTACTQGPKYEKTTQQLYPTAILAFAWMDWAKSQKTKNS